MHKATDDVMIVRLKVDGEPIRFYAGQYINILLPGDGETAQLLVRDRAAREPTRSSCRSGCIPGGKFTTHVFTEMKVGDTVRFEGPLGSFFLREDSDKPIIFVAGATGFAPVKSMVEHAFHIGMKRRMILYWGVRSLRGPVPAGAAAAVGGASIRISRSCRCSRRRSRRTTGPAAPASCTRRSSPTSPICRPPDLRLRLGQDGRGRASGVQGARACRRTTASRTPSGSRRTCARKIGRRGHGEAGRRGLTDVGDERATRQQVDRLRAAGRLLRGVHGRGRLFRDLARRTSICRPGEALVKLSFQHAGQRKEACRERSAEELAKLAPNMRAASRLPARARAGRGRDRDGRQAAVRRGRAADRACRGTARRPSTAASSFRRARTRSSRR